MRQHSQNVQRDSELYGTQKKGTKQRMKKNINQKQIERLTKTSKIEMSRMRDREYWQDVALISTSITIQYFTVRQQFKHSN